MLYLTKFSSHPLADLARFHGIVQKSGRGILQNVSSRLSLVTVAILAQLPRQSLIRAWPPGYILGFNARIFHKIHVQLRLPG